MIKIRCIWLLQYGIWCICLYTYIHPIPQPYSSPVSHLAVGPGPVFSFGHNIQRKNQFILKKSILYYNRDHPHKSLWISTYGALYGITNRLTALVNIPVILNDNSEFGLRSKGLGSTIFQLEYAFYDHFEEDGSRHQMTLVGALLLPSSAVDRLSIFAQPSWGYFLGFTSSNYAPQKWYMYSAFGTAWFHKKQPFSLGQYSFVSMGLGRSLVHKLNTHFALLLDLSIIDARPDFLFGKQDFRTGGNFVGLGPTFKFVHKDFVMLGGLQYPIGQVRGLVVGPIRYRTILSLSWVF